MQQEFVSLLQAPLQKFLFLLEERIMKMKEKQEIKEELEVEELDTKIVTCPHSRQTYARNTLGIIVFSHKDDQSYCDLMNNFAASSIVIIQNMGLTRSLENTATMRALVSSSLVTRKRLYDQLSIAKNTDLADLLEITMKIFEQTRKRDTLVQELITTFGMPVVRNLKLLFQIDEANKYSSQSKYLPMQQLTVHHIKGMQTIIQQATEKRKQTIDDILFS